MGFSTGTRPRARASCVGHRVSVTDGVRSAEKLFPHPRTPTANAEKRALGQNPAQYRAMRDPEALARACAYGSAQFVLQLGAGVFWARGGAGQACVSGHVVVSLRPRHASQQGGTPEGSSMRYVVAACVLGLGLGVALGLLLVMLGDAWEAFDPTAVPAFLRGPAGGVRARRSPVLELVDPVPTAHPDANPPPPSRLSRERGRRTSCAAC